VAIRDTLNEHRQLITGATIGIIVIVLGLIVWEMLPTPAAKAPSSAFYSDDDGKTWFKDDYDKIAPFDHNGKPAVRAYVYSYSGGDFVGYLEKYTDAMKKKLDAATDPVAREALNPVTGLLCKKPMSPLWVRETSPAAGKITDILRPPNNSDEQVTLVEP